MTFNFTKKDFLYLFALSIGIYVSFFHLNAPLFDLDEGAFSEATREMLASGNFLTTYLNGDLRFDKPILIYWLQALSVSFFGLNEFALRLPSAIAASIWAFGIYFFVKLLKDSRLAFLSAFFMVTSLQVPIIAKAAIADSLLNLWIAFSMFSIYLFYEKRENIFIYLTFIFVGLGTLTKGPVAIMIPFVVSGIFFAIKKEFILWLKTILNPKGIVLFLIITAPWYVMEYIDQGQKFINGFFLKHNLERFDSSLEHHKGSIFYFIPVVLLGFLPYTKIFLKALFSKLNFKDDLKLFLVIWFLFVFIFFSLSGTKLPHYVIYGYTGMFILMSFYFDRVDKLFIFLPILLFLVLFIVPIILPYIHIHDRFFNSMFIDGIQEFDIRYRSWWIIATLLFIAIYFINISQLKKIFLIGIIFSFSMSYVLLPTIANIKQLPIKEAAAIAKKYDKVVMYKLNTPTFSVYTQKIIKRKKPDVGEVALTKTIDLKKFDFKYKILYQKNGYSLILRTK